MAPTRDAADTIDFAVQKSIHNHAVREVDRERQREMWITVCVIAGFVIAALGSVWAPSELLQLGYKVEQLRERRAAEESDNRQLRLEWETLRAPGRIERLATGQPLNLVAPGQTEAIVIQRVRQDAAPSRALVARR
ncbi:MAG: cell division protein FtsL [Acidobacteriota bacterium]